MLAEENFGVRKMQRKLSYKTVENSSDQYENIQSLIKEYKEKGNPIISVDVKKKEKLGNFYKDGKCYCNEPPETIDHDFESFADGIIVPHGIYDITKNIGYITLSGSKDTCEFNCDCIKNWWLNYGKYEYRVKRS